jgi:hypothetical protein
LKFDLRNKKKIRRKKWKKKEARLLVCIRY